MEYPEKAWCLVGEKFEPDIDEDDRRDAYQERVVTPRGGQISVKQCMYHTLRTASGTIQTRKTVKHTLGHRTAHFRVDREIEHGKEYEQREGSDGYDSSLCNSHQEGERRVRGR